jgi:cyclophilin family peptidyl-prolyl cis-trans isomerase
VRARRARPSAPAALERLEPRQLLAVDTPLALAPLALGASGTSSIPLAAHFDLAGVTGTVVRMATNRPSGPNDIFVELFDAPGPERTRTTPLTAANFLSYVEAGDYDGTISHRTVRDFIVQAGGFTLDAFVRQGPTVLNEPGNSNVRGTIAMAKVGGDPDSATNQWFFNQSDNSANLDFQNGGFTAFGRVLGAGMALVDAISSLPLYNFGGAFVSTPLWRPVPQNGTAFPEDFVTFSTIDVVPELVYEVSTDRPDLVQVAVSDGRLDVTARPAVQGTATVTVRARSIFDPADSAESSFAVDVRRPAVDFNADGVGDRVWVEANGVAVAHLLDASGAVVGARVLGGGGGWTLASVGDFNADGVSDLAWREDASGATVLWLMNRDGSPASGHFLGGNTEWAVEAVGDYDGNGTTDLVWRQDTSGATVMWLMNGAAATSQVVIGGDTDWRLVSLGGAFDAAGDGTTDLVWRSAATGLHVLWMMNGASITATRWLGGDLGWSIIAGGDYDGDGQGDVLWRESATGGVVQWLLDAGVVRQASFIAGDADWSIVATGAARADGTSDIFWRHRSGLTVRWLMNVATVVSTAAIGGDGNWSLLRPPGRKVV